MTFEEYLVQKKIDPSAFEKGESVLWEEFKRLFDQMHPNSFTAQKLYLINGIRRRFPLAVEEAKVVEKKPKSGKPVVKPAVKPKPAIATAKPKMVKPVIKRPKTDQ